MHGRPLTFVDIDDSISDVDSLIGAFQQIPHRIGQTSILLLRWPTVTAHDLDSDDEDEQAIVSTWLDRLGAETAALGAHQTFTGIVRFRIGESPIVAWVDARRPPWATDGEILARAAAVEIHTLLEWGRAIGRPTTYHYELPSGRHAAWFVRVANAIQSPRDALAISSWLATAVREEMGFLLDTGTLTSVVMQLRTFQAWRGWRSGPVESLDSYPRTRLDAARAARALRGASGGVLGLLSVSSSGAVRDLMEGALSASLDPRTWSLAVLFDRSHPSDREYAVGVPNAVATLFGIDDARLDAVRASTCVMCKDNRVAPVVRIDPRSFDPHVLPEPELVMPSTSDGRDNSGLWDACDSTGAIGVEALPHESASMSRPKGELLPLRVHFEDLLGREPFLRPLHDRLQELMNAQPDDAKGYVLGDLRTCDLIVVTPADRSTPGFEETLKAVRSSLKIPKKVPVAELVAGTRADAFADSSRVMIFALGTVTGWTMRQQLTAFQDAWRGQRGREVYGLVLHARPASQREWQNLFNSYSKNLRAVWCTYLPWWSPLGEEHVALEELRTSRLSLSADGKAFLAERRAMCSPRTRDWRERVRQPGSENVRSVLWGMAPRGGSDRVRNQSLFGWELSAITAYAAIGSAMHERRTATLPNAARLRMFEMPAVARSYFDAILVACVLRWLQPSEAWWGRRDEPVHVVQELVGRTTDASERHVLLPELLLAASLGKMPREAAEVTADLARAHSERWSVSERAPVEVGLALVAASLNLRSS